jgi:hypothetical protein
MTIQVIENLIPLSWQIDIFESVKECPWIYQKNTAYKDGGGFIQGMDIFIDDNTVDSIQFVHYVNWNNAEQNFMYPYLKPLIHMLGDRLNKRINKVHRIKINHQSPQPNCTENNYNIPHTDDPNPKNFTAVYYVNDSDGDTFIFNELYNPNWTTTPTEKLTLAKRVTPKAGTAVVFPSAQLHAGSNPIQTPSRWVINIMFEVE